MASHSAETDDPSPESGPGDGWLTVVAAEGQRELPDSIRFDHVIGGRRGSDVARPKEGVLSDRLGHQPVAGVDARESD